MYQLRPSVGTYFTRNKSDVWKAVFYACIIILLTFIAYIPAMHGGFIWDDNKYVTENPLLTAPDGLKRIWFSKDAPSQYFPLTYTTFWIEYRIWGLYPAGYHVVNVILHIINALLVWRLLFCLSVPGAWLTAAIFAVHPVHVESVAWITERKNVMSCMFFLLATMAWLRFIDHTTSRTVKLYALTMVLYLLALFSKTTAVTLPVVLLLILWFRNGKVTRRDVSLVIPFIILGLAMGVLTMWWERYHQGTQGGEFAFSIVERLLIASRSVWFYPSKLLFPTNLTFSYPRWEIDQGSILQYSWLFGVSIAAIFLLYFKRILGSGFFVAVAFYVVNLLPLLGFIALYTFKYTFVADHYQYIASIGLISLFAAIITRIGDRVGIVVRYFSFLILVFLSISTWQQGHIYKDTETLWRDTLIKNPSSWMAHNNLGNLLAKNGRLDEAVSYYYETLRLKPDFAEAHFNLGRSLEKMSRVDEAISQYEEAVFINPNFAEAHFSLGNAFAKTGHLEEAANHYRETLRIKPDHITADYNLDMILSKP